MEVTSLRRRVLAPLGCAVLLGAGLACREAPPAPPGTPRLVLFIVVDQLRADYLERFAPLLEGGLARLVEESVVFANAHHDHAVTATSPGHATLATGLHPAHHGVVGNNWFDRSSRKAVYSAGDAKHYRSPRPLLAPTLGDRLKARYPRAKVFAIGGKDRAAIFTGGLEADAALWFDTDEGEFVTSSYYPERSRSWLEAFHAEEQLHRHFGEGWSPLFELDELAAYDVEPVDWGFRQRHFPHPLGSASLYPDDSFYADVRGTPFFDAHVVELAKALIEGEGLGQDDYPDFLGVTLPALDLVGHTYGPNSPELADTVVRLDRALAELLDFVDRHLGLDRVVVSLSSDHGVAPIPELLQARGEDAGRFGYAEITCIQRLGRRLKDSFGDEEWLMGGLYVDRELVAERGLELGSVVAELRRGLEECPRIARTFTADDLTAGSDLDEDETLRLFRHSYHPERSADLLTQLAENTLTSSSMASNHGSPYAYDTHVPWLLRLPDPVSRRVEERVYTVDVAPTLGALLGLGSDPNYDGEDREEWLARPAEEAWQGASEP